jgi:hypothetical protein
MDQSDFNLELKIAKIKEKYSNEEVEKMFDSEWPNWVDIDWDEDGYFDTDWDWYIENIGNAAQLVILDYLIDDDTITDEQREILNSKLIEIYPILEL